MQIFIFFSFSHLSSSVGSGMKEGAVMEGAVLEAEKK